LLREVLYGIHDLSKGTFGLSEEFCDQIRRVAALDNDQVLLEIANSASLSVDVNHLRGADPDATLVEFQAHLIYTAEESEQLRRLDAPLFNPSERW
jgi:hypothetical protein